MSESSDEEFDGFSQNEVDAAAQRYNDRLAQIGIGELDVVDNENESENDFSDEKNPLLLMKLVTVLLKLMGGMKILIIMRGDYHTYFYHVEILVLPQF